MALEVLCYLKVHSESINVNTLKKVEFVHERKLFHLGYDNFNKSLDVDKVVFNFSSEITQDGISTNDLKTLKDLSKKPDVIITKPDKALGTINYNVSNFFIPILKRLTLNQYTIQNTFIFVQKLIEIPHAKDYVLASFGVTNLFTNVPLDETIDIIMNSLFDKSDKVLGFHRMYFKKLLDIATKGIMFWFNGTLYKQIEGVAMGSPLGPTLANIFMCYNESKWLQDFPVEFKPKYYFRYVDDTLLFKSEDEVYKFLEYLNNQHPNIKFTCEIEQNGHLPFLDIDISRDMNSFVSSVYKKQTYTGLTI
nr:uncharacterized protein LOC113802249 [Penaeus vannamei]